MQPTKQEGENGARAPRVAVITGGAGALGYAIAQRMARDGVASALWDIDSERVGLAQTLPEARGYHVDVTDYAAAVISKIPMGRLGRAEEVADLVNWIASEECSFCTGAVFDVSGGRATY